MEVGHYDSDWAWKLTRTMSTGTSSRAPSALSIRAKTSKDFRADTSGPSTPVQARGKLRLIKVVFKRLRQ